MPNLLITYDQSLMTFVTHSWRTIQSDGHQLQFQSPKKCAEDITSNTLRPEKLLELPSELKLLLGLKHTKPRLWSTQSELELKPMLIELLFMLKCKLGEYNILPNFKLIFRTNSSLNFFMLRKMLRELLMLEFLNLEHIWKEKLIDLPAGIISKSLLLLTMVMIKSLL